MPNDTLIKSVRSGGAWALANIKSNQLHYFKSSPVNATIAISACWRRVAKLDNLCSGENIAMCKDCIDHNQLEEAYINLKIQNLEIS